MTTKKFDATPTAGEPINLEEISKESVQEAWKDYEAKPEYKAFNKHDLIESMQHSEEEMPVLLDLNLNGFAPDE